MIGARYEVHDGIASITLDNPPVNGLGHEVRKAIVEGLARAKGDPAVRAVVLVGANGLFSGGADIREFNTPRAAAEPTLKQVIEAAEASPKPVVAAIGGTCMGGGLELSLGCHFRVASPDAKVALPEVKLGLVPGAGGTQRLPRLVGAERALDMIVGGNPVAARELAGTALFDRIVEGDLLQGALAFARAAVDEKRPLTLARDRRPEPAAGADFFARARASAASRNRHLRAPLSCIDAVEAAFTRPFDEGLRFERERFLELMGSTESKAMRHAFFGERAAAKIPDVPSDTPVRPVKSVAIVGGGTMGRGIAMAMLDAGLNVTLLERDAAALEAAMAAIRKAYAGAVERGKLESATREERLQRLRPAASYGDIAAADLAIEAVFEEMLAKEAVFRELDRQMKPGAILATNTSTLDVNRIAAATRRPADVVGLHFFSPANVMRLLEVVRADRTAADVLATSMQLARRIGKVAVVSRVCDGFIGNRMLEQYLRQAFFLLDEGASPAQVDRALEDFGMAMGPFRMLDLAGNDIGWAVRKRRYAENPHRPDSRIADRLCEQGRFGQKTGAGWYRYEVGRREALPDPAVDRLIAEHRSHLGMRMREIGAPEIVDRCVLALVNEGARLLEEGIALRASDIDVVYLTGYGFPRHRGGPMFHAETVGLAEVAARMQGFAANEHADPAFWRPAPLLARLTAEGGRFNA